MSFLPQIVAAVVAFGITTLLGFWLIPLLRRLKFGQTILEIGPRWHKNKEGTPTMGGVLFIVGIAAAVAVGVPMLRTDTVDSLGQSSQQVATIILGMAMALAFGVIGYIDDYIIVLRKQNEGLSERQKLVLQVIVAGVYVFGLHFLGGSSTIVEIPFIGQLNLGIFYFPIMIAGIIFIINAVNFADGIDGLCASITAISAISMLIIAILLQFAGMQVLAAALAGGCVGFLVWNLHPAKVFMGDTGSFFLGGMVVAIAFGLGVPVFIVLLGAVYGIEMVSVIIQRYYFKYTRKKYGEGRRIFKMTPIHHHFEMIGWAENKIVMVFSIAQGVFCALAVLAVFLRL